MENGTAGGHELRIGLLGPLTLCVDGRAVDVPGTKRRAVLALLALSSPDPATTDRLIDAIWPDDPPTSARAALQSHVSRIRRHLGPFGDRLVSTGGGYRLTLEAGELDVRHFEGLARAGRLRAAEDPSEASRLLADACDSWRGPPLAELVDVEPLAAWGRAVTESWLTVSDLLAECALRIGDAGAAGTAARGAIAQDPFRESSVLLLMRSLAAEQRTTDAMRAAHDFRLRLRDGVGLDPSPRLAELESVVVSGTVGGPPSTDHASTVRVLPGAARELFGRAAELAGLTRLLASHRLVTIVGPGGVGKTRLAIESCRRAAASTAVTIVALSTVTDPDALPDVLARALGLEAGSGDPLDRCVVRLRSGSHLVLLDTCEHQLDAVRHVASFLLDRCPGLAILATSRERLALPIEQVMQLAPLPMPGTGIDRDLRTVPSVALFLDRARRARADFTTADAGLESVARIVRALDGLPLAIELAAGRLSSMAVTDLEERLDRALDLLGGTGSGESPGQLIDRQGRHRSLRAAVDWSYDLLTQEEQRLFRHLAVFPGGFDLSTAETIAEQIGVTADPATVVAHLVDSSMVLAEFDGPTRYRMLDTLRSFGLDRLDAEHEVEAANAGLIRWAVGLAKWMDDAYETDRELLADQRLRSELANLRTAWRLARDTGDLDSAASISIDLYAIAIWRDLTELFRWALDLAGDPRLIGHRSEAALLGVASESAWKSTGDLDAAESLARRAAAAVRPGDDTGYAIANWALADVMLFRGRYAEGADLAVTARAGTRLVSEGYAQAALAWTYAGDRELARQLHRQAEACVGGPTLRAYLHYIAGEIANFDGDDRRAVVAYRKAIEEARALGASFIVGIASVGLVTAQAAGGDALGALAGYRDLIDRWEETGAWTQQWTTLRNLADLLDRFDDRTTASTLRTAAARAPEASAVTRARRHARHTDATAHSDRTAILDVARQAIGRAEAAIANNHGGHG